MAIKSVKEVVEDLLTRVKKLEDEESGGGSGDSNTVKYVITTLNALHSTTNVTIASSTFMEILNVDYTVVNSVCGLSLSNVYDILGFSFFLDGSLSAYVYCNWRYMDEDPGYYTIEVTGFNTNTKNEAVVSPNSTVVIFYKL